MSDLLTIGEAAEMCGVHMDTLRRWEQRGYLSPHYTKGGHRRYLITDLWRIMHSEEPLNRLFRFVHTGDAPLHEIDLLRGDDLVPSKAHCFEILLVIDEDDQIRKVESKWMLEVSKSLLSVAHPSLLFVHLPINLLSKTDAYKASMFLTDAERIEDISLLPGHGSSERKCIDCGSTYETYVLPAIDKHRCRDMKQLQFGKEWVLTCATSIQQAA